MARRWRTGPTFHRVHDHRHGAAWDEHVVDGLGDAQLVGPLKRLAERHQPVGSRSSAWQVLRHCLDQRDIRQVSDLRGLATLGEHVGIWVEPHHGVEEGRQSRREDARPAADVEQAAVAIQIQLSHEGGFELGRIGRPAASVVRS